MIGAMRFPRLMEHPILDVKLGFALMRDRRVPLRVKAAALVMGLVLTAIVEGLELPIEGLLSVLLPVLGAVGDVVLDGAETVAGPLVLGSLLLPYLAPKDVVARVRAERATGNREKKSPVVDV